MLQKPHGKLATTSSNGDNTVEINEPFETLWDDYEFKDPTLAELVLYRMLVRYKGVPFSAFYKNKNSDTFYLWRIDYQKFIEMGSSFVGTLYAITKEEMNRLLDGEEIDTVMMCQPMRTCLIVEMYDEVEVDGLYDMSWQSDSRLVVREDVHAEPYIDLSYRDLFPEGAKLV